MAEKKKTKKAAAKPAPEKPAAKPKATEEYVTKKEFNKLSAFIRTKLNDRRDNWRRLIKDHVDETNASGKIGSASIWQVVATAIAGLCLCAGTMFGQGDIVDWTSGDGQNNGTAYIDSDQAGTATLTVDAISSALTGDVTTDDINMSGAVGDTLGFNDTKLATVTGLMTTVTFNNITAGSGAGAIDTDYVELRDLTMNNASTQALVWAYDRIVIDDNTAATEDAVWERYVVQGGATVQVVNADAAGFDVGTLKILATAGDLGDGALENVGAISADSLDGDAAGTLPIGAATATRVELADASVVTDVEGSLNVDEGVSVDTALVAAGSIIDVSLTDSGSNTNWLFDIGASITIGDDGDGTLIETNTTATQSLVSRSRSMAPSTSSCSKRNSRQQLSGGWSIPALARLEAT